MSLTQCGGGIKPKIKIKKILYPHMKGAVNKFLRMKGSDLNKI
jgi:hypothetical protein